LIKNILHKLQVLHYQKLVLAVFSLLLFSNSLFNGYCIDDELSTYLNPAVQKGLGGLYEIFTTNYAYNQYGGFEYRPIVKATYALEYAIWGENLFLSHLINVLLFAGGVVLAFSTIAKLFGKKYNPIVFLGLLLFIAHPLHTEVVNNLKSRDELLSFLFFFFSLNLFLWFAYSKRLIVFVAALAVFFLAMLSKLSALPFIILIPLALYYYNSGRVNYKMLAWVFAALTILFIVYFVGLNLFLDDLSRDPRYIENPIFYTPLGTHLGTAMHTLWWYLKLLVYPYPLRFYYGFDQIQLMGLSNPIALFSIVVHAGILAYAIINVKRKTFLAFWALFYLITIFPFSNLAISVPGIIAERFAFLASLSFCMVVGYVVFKGTERLPVFKGKQLLGANVLAVVVTCLLIVPYAIYTFKRNYDWKDRLTLFKADIKYLNKSANANYMFAREAHKEADRATDPDIKRKDYEIADRHYRKAEAVIKDFGLGYYHRGLIQKYYYKNNLEALTLMRKASKTDSLFVDAFYEQALLEETFKEYDMAIALLWEVLVKKPDAYNAKLDLVRIYTLYKPERMEVAQKLTNELNKETPGTYNAFMSNSLIALAKRDTTNHILFAENAFDKDQTNTVLAGYLARYYERKLDLVKANYYISKLNAKP
jgi:hypothetical protein